MHASFTVQQAGQETFTGSGGETRFLKSLLAASVFESNWQSMSCGKIQIQGLRIYMTPPDGSDCRDTEQRVHMQENMEN